MEGGSPCELCRERQRPCTFLQEPSKRSRPVAQHISPELRDKHHKRQQVHGTSPPVSSGGSRAQSIPDLVSDSIPVMSPSNLAPTDHIASGTSDPVRTLDLGVSSRTVAHRPMNYLDESLGFLLSQQHEACRDITDLESIRWEGSRAPVDHVNQNPINEDTERHQSDIECINHQRHSCHPLDTAPGTYRFIGPTGDLDLYILSHRRYDSKEESSVRYSGLKYRRMNAPSLLSAQPDNLHEDPPAVFTLLKDSSMPLSDISQDLAECAESKFASLVSLEPAYRLTLLYATYVHPHFPILWARQLPADLEETNSLPKRLLVAICTISIPFATYDDMLSLWLPNCPPGNTLYRLTWEVLAQEVQKPHLSTIQACLLLLQTHAADRYLPSTPFKPSFMSMTVTLSHCLGLHRDCSQWTNMPDWERKLRARMWWATWMAEKWISLGESVPSTITEDEFDVRSLTESDMRDDHSKNLDPLRPAVRFPYLVSLTRILSGIMSAFFTVRASSNTATNIELSLEIAKPFRERLKQWHASLPSFLKQQVEARDSSEDSPNSTRPKIKPLWDLNANGTFYLAYLTVQLTLFRALLRPLSNMASAATDVSMDFDGPGATTETSEEQKFGAVAIIKGSIVLIKEVVEFGENLDASEWDAFWDSCELYNSFVHLTPTN